MPRYRRVGESGATSVPRLNVNERTWSAGYPAVLSLRRPDMSLADISALDVEILAGTPTPVGIAFNIVLEGKGTGRAIFRKYDDWWRVQRLNP